MSHFQDSVTPGNSKRVPHRRSLDAQPMQQLEALHEKRKLAAATSCSGAGSSSDHAPPDVCPSPSSKHRLQARKLLKMAVSQENPNSKALFEEMAQTQLELTENLA